MEDKQLVNLVTGKKRVNLKKNRKKLTILIDTLVANYEQQLENPIPGTEVMTREEFKILLRPFKSQLYSIEYILAKKIKPTRDKTSINIESAKEYLTIQELSKTFNKFR